ncbi:MAG: purine-binding chemotaxis protein CheW [Thaumarchaeota archaeon]|nr:purine-binding chemotaxis protein CheW [Nitrososphaerota archaeon]MDE1838518.1 purine-binding chemotaxis protein CheW [Nitrososphaerota archaeon]
MSETIIEGNLQMIVFSLFDSKLHKKEEYGVLIEQVREIRPLESITKIPNAKSYVRGVMNLRGMIIPVIDVKEKLGFSSDGIISQKSRVLVADVNGNLTGLLIDEVDQVVRITSKEVETSLSGDLESLGYIKGVAKISGRLVVILDMEKLLEGTTSSAPET